MAIPNTINIGLSGLNAAKAGISTTGHNITNANTEGYSRQRVVTETATPVHDLAVNSNQVFGTGTKISRIERINDEYIEKQVRNSQKELDHLEEKDLGLKQIEDIFNEMNGDGLNRIVSRFFNEFRKLADEPENVGVRQAVREATQNMVNEFHRIRNDLESVRNHLDSRIEGFIREANARVKEIKDLNERIRIAEISGGSPNDLLDKRDLAVKKLGSLLDVSVHKDRVGDVNLDVVGDGPLISGGEQQPLSVERSPADDDGKPEGAFDVISSSSIDHVITHRLKGGKIGALLEVRDNTVSTILDRLDEMAFTLTQQVNEVHSQGIAANGRQNVDFFKKLSRMDRASEFISLSDDVLSSVNNIATGLDPESPGDNRVAIAISSLQYQKIMDDGLATADEWYNSIVSDVGVLSAMNRSSLAQQKDIMVQLNKMRDQISGVSIDEETTNLLQFQHAFDASAKVIQAADEMVRTVLALKRD